MAKLAFYTFGILTEVSGHPAVKGFVDREEGVFRSLENSPGFIERAKYKSEAGYLAWGRDIVPRFYNPEIHAQANKTLSLWQNIESVFAFSYSGNHLDAIKSNEGWSVKPEWPLYVAWWVEDDHRPNWQEGKDKFEHLHDHGSTKDAFSFKEPFDEKGNKCKLNKKLIKELGQLKQSIAETE